MSEIEVARYALRTFRPVSTAMERDNTMLGGLLACRGLLESFLGIPYVEPPVIELASVGVPGSHWARGECVAACLGLFALWGVMNTPVLAHPAPQEDCHCGLYGTLTLQSLQVQYPQYAARIVTVIAAEGQTIIGDTGLRTERARVVAYWCQDDLSVVAARQFVDAMRFPCVGDMLEAYHFPREDLAAA